MITFQQVRNATVKLMIPGITFMIDPWLMDACGAEERDAALAARSFIPKPVCPLPASADEIIHDVDAFLVTHIHPDHFSADYLPKDIPLICQNETDACAAARMGFTGVSHFQENAPCITGGVTIYRVDARHGDTDELAKRMGKTSGFVFVHPGEKTIYLAGDTVYFDGVKAVIERFAPDVIIVNACDARARLGRLVMNTEDVKKTCDCRPDSPVIASHMDTVTHAHLSRAQLHEALAGSRYERQVLIPADGERIQF